MAKNRIKKPKPKNTKHIEFKEEHPDYDDYKPIFSFCHMKYGKEYCVSRCTIKSKSSLVSTILQLSQLKWKKILSSPKETFGKENIPLKQFKATFNNYAVISPDVNVLMVFRFSKSERMAGIRLKNVYEILAVGKDLYEH